jgi:hypothetical protein
MLYGIQEKNQALTRSVMLNKYVIFNVAPESDGDLGLQFSNDASTKEAYLAG